MQPPLKGSGGKSGGGEDGDRQGGHELAVNAVSRRDPLKIPCVCMYLYVLLYLKCSPSNNHFWILI